MNILQLFLKVIYTQTYCYNKKIIILAVLHQNITNFKINFVLMAIKNIKLSIIK